MEGLKRLYELLLQEREAAKELDMDRLMSLLEEKEELLPLLEEDRDLASEEKELVRTLLQENRRNAYLFNSALNWIRENMELLQAASSPAVYGSSGTVQRSGEGNLLSGKV